MEDLQKILFEFDVDGSLFDAKVSKASQSLLALQGQERDAHLSTLGVLQKNRIETELLRKARERAQNPTDIQRYTERVKTLTAETRRLTGAMQPRTDNIFSSISQGLGIGAGFSIVQGIQRAAGAIVTLTGATLKAASANEATSNSLKTMLGNREKATQLQADIIDLVKKSPFELVNANDYVKRLLAMGIAHKDVIADLKSLGDIAAGVGQEKMPQIILAFGQVKAAGRLMGGELKQFTEAGVPLLEELAKQAGKSTRSVRKSIEDGNVSFAQVRDAMRSLSGEGGKFFNLMEKQATTLSGMLSNLSDVWGQLEVAMGEKFTPAAKAIVQILSDITEGVRAFIATPLSEKLEEERDTLNGLVLAAVSLNDNYESRAALIREIKSEYPDFLAGLDAETVSNDALIKRLEAVNGLYRARISLQVAKEDADPIKEKFDNYQKSKIRSYENSLRNIKKEFDKSGKSFNEEQLRNTPQNQKEAFLKAEAKRAGFSATKTGGGLASGVVLKSDLFVEIEKAFSQNAKLEKENAEAQIDVLKKDRNVKNAAISVKKEQLTDAENTLKSVIQDRDAFKKGSDDYNRLDALAASLKKEQGKVKVDYAKAEIDRLELELSKTNGFISQGETIANGQNNDKNFEGEKQTRDYIAKMKAYRSQLLAEKLKFEKDLPKEIIDSAEDKGASKAKSKAQKLKEDRIKAKQDLAKELFKINTDIAKLEDKDTYDSVERIKKRVKLEIDTEREGLKVKRDKFVQDKVFSKSEAGSLFAPLFAKLEEKQRVSEGQNVDRFRKESYKTQAENAAKLNDLALDAATERLNLLGESLEKENALLLNHYEKQGSDIGKKFAEIKANLKTDYDKGLLSVLSTDVKALEEAAAKYAAQLLTIEDLENKAFERNSQARRNALLELNQKALDKAKEETGDLFKVFETGRSEDEAKEIQTETEKYIRGQFAFEEYQKRILAIEKRYKLLAANYRIKALNQEMLLINQRISATESNKNGASVDPKLVLNDKDLEAAKKEIIRLRGELAKADIDLSGVQAGEKNEKNDAFKAKITKFLDGYQLITDAALNAFRTINEAELNSINASITAQERRVEQAKALRDRGNVEYLEEEEKRARILDEKRRKALARQQFLDRLAQLSSVSVGVAKAFAESGGKFTAVTIASSIAALVAGYSLVNSLVPQNTQRFNKGTPFVRRPFGIATGVDTVPAMLTEGERVVTKRDNSDFGESFDMITSRKMSPKDVKKRLLMDYERIDRVNSFNNQVSAMKSKADMLLEKQISQNAEIIELLRGGTGATVNLNIDRKGFMLGVSGANIRENKRNA